MSQNMQTSAYKFNPYCRSADGNGVDFGEDSIVNAAFTIADMRQNYLFGLPMVDPEGNPFPDGLYIHHLNAAIVWCEAALGIQMSLVNVLEETQDYRRMDYMNWGYIQLYKFPIIEVTRLELMYGNTPAVKIPLDWIRADKLTGKLELFPVHGSANALAITSGGMLLGASRWDRAPHAWSIDYKAGLMVVPHDLIAMVYKKACCGVLDVYGDLILGAGIASQSISIDGLSQSIGTTQSAMFGACSARIDSYRREIEAALPALKMRYTGIRMVVI